MLQDNNHGTIVLQELLLTVEQIGVDKTTAILKNARTLNLQDQDMVFVIKELCLRFKLDAQYVITSKDKEPTRLNCIKSISYYLHHCFNYTFSRIGVILCRDKSAISNYYHEIVDIKDNKPNHALQKHFIVIDMLISEYKSHSKKNNNE